MASTITGTSTNWTITSPAGQLAGAARNHANASLTDDGTVVIKSADGVLWAGDIMTLAGLAGATPALRFTDLLNNFLTGLTGGAFVGAQRYNYTGAVVSWSTGAANTRVPLDTLSITTGAAVSEPNLASAGSVKINTTGTYLLVASLLAVRTAGAATMDTQVAGLFANATQLTRTRSALTGANRFVIEATLLANLTAGQIITFSTISFATPAATTYQMINNGETHLDVICLTSTTTPPNISIPTQRFTFNGVQPTYTTGDPDLIIPFDTLQYSSGSTVAVLTSPGVITIQEGGMYLVSANVSARRTAGATVNDVVPVNINRNGVQDGGRFRATTVDNQRFTLFGTNVLQCSAGDVISFTLPNYTAPPATTYEILNSASSSGCALSVIKL